MWNEPFQISSEIGWVITYIKKKSLKFQFLTLNHSEFWQSKNWSDFPKFYLAAAILDFTTLQNMPHLLNAILDSFKSWYLTVFLGAQSKNEKKIDNFQWGNNYFPDIKLDCLIYRSSDTDEPLTGLPEVPSSDSFKTFCTLTRHNKLLVEWELFWPLQDL